MLPRSGELFVVVVVVALAFSFHRMGALGDWLGRLFGKRVLDTPPKS